MSSGSKSGPRQPMKGTAPVQNKFHKVSAEKIVEEREARNTRARANLMLHEQKKAMEPAQDEFHEPGRALKLLGQAAAEASCKQPAKKEEEEKEYGAWCSADDPHGLDAAAEDQPGFDEKELEDIPEEDGMEEKAEPEDEANAEEPEGGANGEEPADDADEPADDGMDEEPEDEQQQDDGWWNNGKQKGHKGAKGKWQRKPWWAQTNWKGQKGSGRKGQGKGKYDQYGGEYCHGGYRAVNGEFFPHLGFISAWLDVAAVDSNQLEIGNLNVVKPIIIVPG